MLQASLFQYLPAEDSAVGLGGLMPSIRAEMNRVESEYEPGRKMLAEAISKIARREGVTLGSTGAKSITEDTLNKLLQSGDEGRDPSLKLVLCFCLATKDFSPLRPIFKLAGLVVIPKDDLRYLEYVKTCDASLKYLAHGTVKLAMLKISGGDAPDASALAALEAAGIYPV